MARKSLKSKKVVYNKVFKNELGKEVLSDLRRFCNATQTSILVSEDGKIDALQIARMEGRREVFLQIMNMMKIDFEQYYDYQEDFD